jgi:very-short-patch-repair endonuclease
MASRNAFGVVARLGERTDGVFRGAKAIDAGVTRKQLHALLAADAIERVLPDTYRVTAVARSATQSLRAALLWGGPDAAAARRSAAETYALEGVRARQPEIAVPTTFRGRVSGVTLQRYDAPHALMFRTHNGLRVTGPEATIVSLGTVLDSEKHEIACEDARRRGLTSIAALRRYGADFPGRRGAGVLRALLDELDPKYPSRSTLEVKTRRLLVAHGIREFEREFPLEWIGRTYYFDFAFPRERVILETNGRRWHDNPRDYEDDQEKWSVPARYGYKIVFATWLKVRREPSRFVGEIRAMLTRAA